MSYRAMSVALELFDDALEVLLEDVLDAEENRDGRISCAERGSVGGIDEIVHVEGGVRRYARICGYLYFIKKSMRNEKNWAHGVLSRSKKTLICACALIPANKSFLPLDLLLISPAEGFAALCLREDTGRE